MSLFLGGFCAIAFEEKIRITEIGENADFGDCSDVEMEMDEVSLDI